MADGHEIVGEFLLFGTNLLMLDHEFGIASRA